MNSFLNWFGGKRILSNTIVKLIPEHTCYVEVFAGAAWVLFKKEPSKAEVLNDLDGELVNLYRVVQNHPGEFLTQFRLLLISRQTYDEWNKSGFDGLTDIQRAARFYFIAKLSFGGIKKRSTYGYSTVKPSVLNPEKLPKLIEDIHERIKRVNIEKLDFEDCTNRYDRSHTIFYVDPPYYGIDVYRVSFTKEDHLRLFKALKNIKGKFILSLNDVPEVRKLYSDYFILEKQVRYTCGKTNQVYFPELIITNFNANNV